MKAGSTSITSRASNGALTQVSPGADFTLLWSGGILSDLGSWSSELAVPLLVLTLTGSPAKAGLIGTVGRIAAAITRLPGGALADRWNRRALLLVSNALAAFLMGVLALAVYSGFVSLWLIVLAVAGTAVCSTIFSPAERAAIARLVPAEALATAFARNEARTYGAALGGPPIGGVLFGLGAPVPFFADAVSFIMSFGATAAIRAPLQEPRSGPAKQSLLSDIREGVRHVLHSPFLRAVVSIAVPLNVAVTGAIFTVTLALEQSRTPASLIGVAQAALAVGGLLGSFVATVVLRHLGLRQLVVAATATMTLALVVGTTLSGSLSMTAPLAAALFLAPSINAGLFGRLATVTPDNVQGRVLSVVALAATGTASLAPSLMGILTSHFDGRAAMSSCSIAAAIATVFALKARGTLRALNV